jgi:hypothetical protein
LNMRINLCFGIRIFILLLSWCYVCPLLIFLKREMINVAREYITKHILKVFDWGWSNIDPAYFPCHLKIKLPKNRFREVLATHYPNPTQIF